MKKLIFILSFAFLLLFIIPLVSSQSIWEFSNFRNRYAVYSSYTCNVLGTADCPNEMGWQGSQLIFQFTLTQAEFDNLPGILKFNIGSYYFINEKPIDIYVNGHIIAKDFIVTGPGDYSFNFSRAYVSLGANNIMINMKNAPAGYGQASAGFVLGSVSLESVDGSVFEGCLRNSDCGTDGFLESGKCYSNNLWKKYLQYTCQYPGTIWAKCINTTSEKFNMTCPDKKCGNYSSEYCKNNALYKSRNCTGGGCSNGTCISNNYTEEIKSLDCGTAGCSNGKCNYACSKNSDCGTDAWTNGGTCYGNNLWQKYLTYTCQYPNTIWAKCVSTTSEKFKETCDEACFNGLCKTSNSQIKWIKSHQFSSGLVESQVGWPDHRSFTYDQALAIIALTHYGDLTKAKQILNTMARIQNADGSWYDAYYTDKLTGWEWGKSTGNTAWMVIAINYYESKTSDKTYSASAEKSIAWMKKRINTGNQCTGALNLGENFWNIPNPYDIFSTEHNLDAYSAFINRGKLSDTQIKRSEYYQTADNIKNFLTNNVWKGNYFIRGCNDYELWLDAQTWGYLALGDNYYSAVDYANSNMKNTLNYNGKITEGFQYNNYNKNSIWVEGTAQMADVFAIKGDSNSAKYLAEINKIRNPDSGIPYSFNEAGGAIVWPDNLRYSSVSSAAWTYFAENKINPFQPGITEAPLKCEDSDALNFYNKGSAKTFLSGKYTTYTDYCSGNWVYEYYCTDWGVSGKWFACKCANGACILQSDYSVEDKTVGTAIEHRFSYKGSHFMTLIETGGALSLRPHPGNDVNGWGSSLYLQPFLPGAVLSGNKVDSITLTSNSINVLTSGKVSRGASSSYGTWNSAMEFRFDKTNKKISGNGSYLISLSGNLGDTTGDLNLYKLASNYLDDVPLLSGGIGDTGDMERADVIGNSVFTWIPENQPGHFPPGFSDSLSIDAKGKYNNVDTAAQGYVPIAAAYKPSLKVILNSKNQGVSMIFGGIYDTGKSKQFWADNVGITPLILKSSQDKIFNFNVNFESEALPNG